MECGKHIVKFDGALVFLAETAWTLQTVRESFPKVEFRFTSEAV